jgi:hypothetical protein
MAPRLAPVLHELAGRLAGRPVADARTEPMQWAYALRDAVGLAHPDVLISHWDPDLEADAMSNALTAADGDGDWVDRLLAAPPLAQTAPASAGVELVATLAGLFRSGPEVAAAVTGPVTTAAALAPELLLDDAGPDDRIELADLCADALAGLIGAYGEAGASRVVVIEHDADFLDAADLVGVQSPLVRALAHQRVEGIFVAPPPGTGAEAAGYGATAMRWDGSGAAPDVALVPADLWALPPEQFAERWPGLATAAGSALLISAGPLPAAMPLENLQTARAAHA